MLTLLSRLFRSDTRRDFAVAAAWLATVPQLRLVDERDALAQRRDIPVAAVESPRFVAGEGARIYSLDAFRIRRTQGPRAA